MLRIKAMKFGVADAVQWLGVRQDIPALLDAADGFVLGSAWEGMPENCHRIGLATSSLVILLSGSASETTSFRVAPRT